MHSYRQSCHTIFEEEEKQMAPYSHHVNTYHRAKRARKVKKAGQTVVILFLLFGVGIGVDWLLTQMRQRQNQVSSESLASVQSSTINIFRTPYFQFQADRTWREIEIDRKPDTFVYRSFNGNLVQHEIIVEINRGAQITLANEQTSRVLPVEESNNSLVAVGDISPHCSELLVDKTSEQQQFVTYKQVEFPCNPDSSQFVVLVGQVAGNHLIEKKTADGIRTYKITYRDSTFTPTGRPLPGIINSFQLL